jgi:diamine N-acetyltransferase
MKLRMLDKKDADGMLEWMHDPEVYRYFRFSCEETNKEKAVEFIRNAQIQFIKGNNRHYAIADNDDNYLGTISLKDIDMQSLNAEFAISMRAAAQGQGIAMEATKELLKIAFEEIGLQRVYLNVLSDNDRAVHLYEKCGFVYEGEFRNHIKIRGEMKSLKWYGILKDEFTGDSK